MARIRASLIAAALLVLAAAAPVALGAERVFWANGNNTISYANLDGTGGGGQLNLSGATANGPRGVAIDPVTRRLYWGNQGNDTISYANLDGTGHGGQLDITGATIAKPHGVAIDPVTRRIYWANDEGNPISYADLDGSGGAQLDTSGSHPDGPYGVALDRGTGRIYWANRTTNTISYAKLDGSGGGGELDVSGATPAKPHGVTIDPEAGKIYWANLGNTISYANLDGSGHGGELSAPDGPVGMAIDPAAGLMYMANLGNSTISYFRLDGSGAGTLNTSGATPSGSRFLALDRSPHGTSAPAISGESAIGSVLSCSLGSWATDLPGAFLYRAPKTFAYQWSRDGVDIAGATTSLYTVFASGDYRCRVTASNEAGDTPQTSAPHTVAAAVAVGPTGTTGTTGTTANPPEPASFAGSPLVVTVNRTGLFSFSFRATRALRGRAIFTSAGRVLASRKVKRLTRVTLTLRSFTVPSGGRVALRIWLSRRSFQILRMNGRIRTRVTVILRDAAGLTSTASQTITLVAPAQRPR